MPTPPKPVRVLADERKSHRTQAELAQRKAAEAELITGKHMQMWADVKTDPIAKKEFTRVKALLKKIGKDDALYEGVVNRYAQMKSECVAYEQSIEAQRAIMAEATEKHQDKALEFLEFVKILQEAYGNIARFDRQIQAKRKMMLDIEKENIMTIASALRSIPKKAGSKEQPTGMQKFMNQRTGGGA
jgi:hypothetical protein